MYESWPPPAGSKTSQITKPKRGTNLSSDNESKNAFESGRNSECELDLISWGKNGEALPKRISTTQGRLYSCFWHGNLDVLEINKTPQPVLPLMVEDARKMLKALGKNALSNRAKSIPTELRGTQTIFAMVTDKTSKLTKQKLRYVKAALGKQIEFNTTEIHANEFFWEEGFCPTTYLTLITSSEDVHEEIFKKVKLVLYQPDPNAKNPKFNLHAHGVFLTRDVVEDDLE